MLNIKDFYKKVSFSLLFGVLLGLPLFSMDNSGSSSSNDLQLNSLFPLQNSMGICYANSTLQCLFRYQSLKKLIKENEEKGKPEKDNYFKMLAEIKKLNGNGINNLMFKLFNVKDPKDIRGSTTKKFLHSLFRALVFQQLSDLNINVRDSVMYYTYTKGKLYKVGIKDTKEDRVFIDFKWGDLDLDTCEDISQTIDFDVNIIFVPTLNVFVIFTQGAIEKKQLLDKEFKTKISNLLLSICHGCRNKRFLPKSDSIGFELKGFTAILDNPNSSHQIAYVKRSSGKWFLCNDEANYDLGGHNAINHLFEDLLSDEWFEKLQRGKFNTARVGELFFEITNNDKNDIDFNSSSSSSSSSSPSLLSQPSSPIPSSQIQQSQKWTCQLF